MYRTHICPKCRRCFKMRSHLQEHLHLHFPNSSLQCPTCKRFFTSRSKLRIHRRREAGEKVHHCHLCEYSAVERSAIHRHLSTMHAEEAEDDTVCRRYPCPTCGQSFTQSRALKSHMKTHNVQPDCKTPVACFQEGCSFQTFLPKALVRHAAEVHDIKAVECRHHACSAIFPGEKEMEAHYRTHLAYHCSQCDFSCSNKTAFLRHQRHGHAGSEKLCCDFCTFFTFNPVEFEQHTGHLHANEKIHQCPQCSYVTSHKRGLRRHMLKHSVEKPFKCSLCDFRCRDVSYLSKHMLTHSDNKNFMCAECGYVTKWKHYLNVHMRKHAGELRYECDQCPYRCHRMDQLNSHKLRHQAKSLMCEICAYVCKRTYELRNHMLAKHSVEGKQASVYKCKYCTYTTRFRQALQNHENCIHTRLKQFCCALCPYSSFSSISLFLHKKKTHGYVPGDKTWLQNYAAKERQRNSSNMLHNVCNEPLTCNERSKLSTEEAPTDFGANEAPAAIGSLNDEEVSPLGTSPEYCTLVLTTVTADNETAILPNEDASPLHCNKSVQDKILMVHEEVEKSPAADSHESEQEPLELDHECGSSQFPSEKNQLECLKPKRAQEKDQADAMVLEGRVQMLVVPSKYGHGGDRSSSMTRKEKTLKLPQHHECQACGAQFKQRRGLSSHLSKKCPAIPRKIQTFTGIAVTPTEDGVDPDTSKNPAGTISHEECLVQQKDTATSESAYMFTEADHEQSNTQTERLSEVRHGDISVQNGTFMCSLCSFSSVRLATVNRHVSICQKPLQIMERKTVSKDKKSESIQITEEQSGEEFVKRPGEVSSAMSNGGLRKALDLPEKSNELHCSMCPFVDKSKISTNHINKNCRPMRLNQSATLTSKQERGKTRLKQQDAALHTCSYCSFSTTRRYRLEEHESLHTGIGRHTCDICNKTFGALTKLRQHKVRIHDKRPSQACTLCDYRGYALDDVRRHTLRCHTGEMHHICLHCEVRFSSEVALRNHCKRVHQLQVLLSCKQCDYSCSDKATLRTHQQSKHTAKNCTTCQESLGTKESIKAHRRTHLAHQCQLCPFSSKTKQLLAQHLLDEHEDGCLLDKPLGCSSCPFACQHPLVLEQHLRSHGGKRVYQCTDCKYTTGNKQKMTWHVRIHTGEKPYRCENCSYTCIDPSRLKVHMRVHQEEKKYLCPACGYKCKWATQLKYHMTKHTGEKPHVCDQCSYRTNRADALRAHQNTQHCDVRSYVCEKCGKAFKTSFILKTHQRQHSDQRSYICGLCDKAFRWPAGLRHHFLSHTKQQPFRCCHCPYRAKQKFQVIKHLQRHHPDMPVQQGVVRDSEAGSLTLKEALQGRLKDSVVAAEEEGQ
nr:zinc finger protein 142 isoform X2 [Doryrhamphus excisus]